MSRKIKYGDPWDMPSAEEVEAAVSAVGGVSATCRLLRKGKGTISRWCDENDSSKIDFANWQILKKVLK